MVGGGCVRGTHFTQAYAGVWQVTKLPLEKKSHFFMPPILPFLCRSNMVI